MNLKLEPQGSEFSWKIAYRNALLGACGVAIALPGAVLMIESTNLASKPLLWFVQVLVFLPVTLFTFMLAFFTPLQRVEWWWRVQWVVEMRRKRLTQICIFLCMFLPLLHTPTRHFFFESENENPLVLILLLYALLAYIVAVPIGTLLSWGCVFSAGKLASRSSFARRIHDFFSRDEER